MNARAKIIAGAACTLLLAGCVPAVQQPAPSRGMAAMNQVSEPYVKLVLALGRHDADYVDAYYGPPAWKAQADSAQVPLPEIRSRAVALLQTLDGAPPTGLDETGRLRHGYLSQQLRALIARVDMLGGQRLAFDAESQALYNAVAPTRTEDHFRQTLGELDRALGGPGAVAERYQKWRNQFVIPPERLDTVFRAAIAECRSRTAPHIPLPPEESFTVEYVTGKAWSAYNWYQGGFRSLIQVNTGLPIYIDRAVDLACHEGYPGHHVYNALLEQNLVRGRGWMEFAVYPLFSPQSLIAEGSANYGIEMAFPGQERVEFERRVLFPLAGLDGARAAEYYRVADIVRQLGYAGNEAARRYLNGQIDRATAAEWLTRYALMAPEVAEQRVRFFDRYRSYVINYNLGQDLVRAYVEAHAGAGATPERRWQVFRELLSSPRLLADLRTR